MSSTSIPRGASDATVAAIADRAPGVAHPFAGKQVLILIHSDEGGGVEYLAGVMRSDLVSKGAQVDVHFLYANGRQSKLRKLGGIAKTAWEIIRRRPDVLVSFQPTASTLAGLVGLLSGCRARIVHQSNMPGDSDPVARVLDRAFGSIGLYSVIIANSKATEAAFTDYPAAYRRRMIRIEHGVSCPPVSRDRSAVLSRHAIPERERLLLGAARLSAQKGLARVVVALASLPGARLAIAGQGPERERLEALAEQHGVADRVHFLGYIDRAELAELYAVCDLFVFPSDWETFGLAAVEAAILGAPIVAKDLPVLREVLCVDGVCPSVFVASTEPEVWSQAIAGALLDTGFSERARAFAEAIADKYGEPRMLAEFAEVAERLVT
jgi:glycosyltransferase involved in cell wall biosynthesis